MAAGQSPAGKSNSTSTGYVRQSLFQNGVRVATTVKNDEGERAIGTVVSDEVRAVVLTTGQPYRGEAFVVNKPYLTAYDAIRDPDGRVIGMVVNQVVMPGFAAFHLGTESQPGPHLAASTAAPDDESDKGTNGSPVASAGERAQDTE